MHSLVELRHAGVSAIKYDLSTPLLHVRKGFPDQRSWMGESRVQSISEVMSDWGYHGPLEMFSVMLCVCCDAEVQEYEVQQLRALRLRIIQERKDAMEMHGYEGHPVLTIRAATQA